MPAASSCPHSSPVYHDLTTALEKCFSYPQSLICLSNMLRLFTLEGCVYREANLGVIALGGGCPLLVGALVEYSTDVLVVRAVAGALASIAPTCTAAIIAAGAVPLLSVAVTLHAGNAETASELRRALVALGQ